MHMLVRSIEYFRCGRHESRELSDTERPQTKEVTTLPTCPASPICPTLRILPQRKGSKVLRRAPHFTCWRIKVSTRLTAGCRSIRAKALSRQTSSPQCFAAPLGSQRGGGPKL